MIVIFPIIVTVLILALGIGFWLLGLWLTRRWGAIPGLLLSPLLLLITLGGGMVLVEAIQQSPPNRDPLAEMVATVVVVCAGVVAFLTAGGGLSLGGLALRAGFQGRWLSLPDGDGQRIRRLLMSLVWAVLGVMAASVVLVSVTALVGEPNDALKPILGLLVLAAPVAALVLGLLGKLPGTR